MIDLLDAGYDTPVTGGLAGLDATDLLLAVADIDYPMMRAELTAWLARRSSEEAVTDLAAAVSSLDDPALRNVALAVMSEIDVELAQPEVRRLAGLPPAVAWRCVDQPPSTLLSRTRSPQA